MGKANLFGIVMIILCINIFLFIAGVRVVEDTSNDFLGRFVATPAQEDFFSTDTTMALSGNCSSSSDESCFKDVIPDTLQESGGSSGILTFIDTVKIVWDFVIFLINILFTPIGLFVSLPALIGLIFGIPLLVAGILSLVFFIRSGA